MSINNPSREYLWALRMVDEWREYTDTIDYTEVNFTVALFDLIHVADHYQKAKIARSFPVEFAAYCAWNNAGILTVDKDNFVKETIFENSPLETSGSFDRGIYVDPEHAQESPDSAES